MPVLPTSVRRRSGSVRREVAAAILGCLALTPTACAPGPAVDREPLNVVLVVIDDLGWADTGVYGSSFYETPNIDRLAAQGVRFTQFYTASPVCSPTRASLMTGRHPARLRLTNWIGGEQNGLLRQADYIRALPLVELTVGEAFQEAGYATGYVGKWHLGPDGYMPEDQGFEWIFAVNHAGEPGSYFPPYERPSWAITNVPDLQGDPPDSYLTDRLTDVSLDFLEAHADTSFLLVLSHYAVHTPLQAPDSLIRRYETKAAELGPETGADFRAEHESVTKLRQDHATYAAMVRATDESVGRILDRLDDLGIADRTAVVFVSDNGGLSTLLRRSFNLATSNEPLRGGKGWLYEGGIRAPFLVRWPGGAQPGSVVHEPAVSHDIYPTLLAMAGLPPRPDQHMDGVDLTGLMQGGALEGSARDTLYWHFPHYHGSGNRPSAAVRAGDWKLIHWFEDGASELYDLGEDPAEARNLAALEPEVTAGLEEHLLEWLAAVGANLPTPMGPGEG